MKRNNRGFMLVEVIVVSTVVVVAMIFLYTTFSRLYNNYKVKNTYFNIDATYATKKMIDSMIDSRIINSFIGIAFNDFNYRYIIDNCSCDVDAPYVCDKIQSLYGVNNMILVEYDESQLDKLTGLNQTFLDYINYLKKYYNINNTNGEYTYIVLTETLVNGKNYYGNLRIR